MLIVKKPELFLSVSHAKGWFAVSISTEPVGVDIQTYSSRLKEGQDYFRNERELPFADNETALHLIWCAKEAFYKMKEGQIVDLKEHVTICSISENEVNLNFENEFYSLRYHLVENGFFIYTV